MSNLINKAKDVLHSEKHHNTTSTSTNAGPHDSNVANKMDPRVDSDLDGSRMTHGTTGAAGITGTSSTTHGSTNIGPHNSNFLNKMDPRVDSDADHRNNPASTMGSTRSGLGSSTMATTTHGSKNAGPHNSKTANKMDPRVDSDMDGSRTTTGTNCMTGATGTHHCTGTHTAGPHNSNTLNKMDPTVDSDLSGRRI